ncbi:MAG: hypothetical protein FWH23_04885 [Bacteroidales bacterium]|nr:hypothetical protein [Bacteroidales bacterium]MCL2133265.1 hypothetical protein [Bacteroidales bacterium]
MHRLFVRNENYEFHEEENVNVPVHTVTYNHVNFYLENYVFSDPHSRSTIILFSDLAIMVEKNIRKYDVPVQFEMLTKKSGIYGSDIICSFPCWPEAHNKICQATVTGYRCQEGCFTQAVSLEIATGPMEVRGCQSYIDMPLMYSFKDEVLSKSARGEEYIDNYYYLSAEYQKNINLDLAMKTALVLKDFNPVMEAFLEPQQRGSEIMFGEKLSKDILDLIDEYEKITRSRKGKEILNSIRQDVANLKNKTLTEIRSMQ